MSFGVVGRKHLFRNGDFEDSVETIFPIKIRAKLPHWREIEERMKGWYWVCESREIVMLLREEFLK